MLVKVARKKFSSGGDGLVLGKTSTSSHPEGCHLVAIKSLSLRWGC